MVMFHYYEFLHAQKQNLVFFIRTVTIQFRSRNAIFKIRQSSIKQICTCIAPSIITQYLLRHTDDGYHLTKDVSLEWLNILVNLWLQWYNNINNDCNLKSRLMDLLLETTLFYCAENGVDAHSWEIWATSGLQRQFPSNKTTKFSRGMPSLPPGV